MTKTNRLIPQNKFDTSTIKQLERIKTEQISTISMQLLEWIADMNWPVAQELIKVLPRFHKELMIDIKYILSDKVSILYCPCFRRTAKLFFFPTFKD